MTTFAKILFSFIFFCSCAGLLFIAVGHNIDKDFERECSSCDVEYSWCKDYWKTEGLCGLGDVAKSEVGHE